MAFGRLTTPNSSQPNASALAETEVNPVSVSVHRFRVFGISIALVGILVALTIFLIDGLKIDTRDASNLSDTERSKLLDRYNTFSGGIGSIISLPFQPFVAMLVPVFFVCYTTNSSTNGQRSLIAMKTPMIVAAAISWLVGQGMGALNVQFDSPTVEFIISANDLLNVNAESAFRSTVTSVTDTTTLAGIPSTDTILRAAIQPLTPNYTTSCLVEGGILANHPEASVRFGFPLNSWLEDMLPESIASDEWFSFTMGNSFASGEIETSSLPGGDLNKTAELFSYALWGVWTALAPAWSTLSGSITTTSQYKAMDTSDAANLLTSVQALITDYDGSESAWADISVPEISVTLATFNPSQQVKFESISFDLPVKNSTMNEWTSNETDSDWTYETTYGTGCNDHACVMGTPIVDGLQQDQVRMIRLCMLDADGSQENLEAIAYSATNTDGYTCKFVSKSSVLIFSLARHVTVDQVTITERSLDSGIVLIRPRVTYKVTIGRLSWDTNDLAQVYGASCADGADCEGLYFPLGNGSQHAVVGKANLPVPMSVTYPQYFASWQALAIANTHLDMSDLQGDIFYPPMYPITEGSVDWNSINPTQCAFTGSDFINDVIQQHMYSKDSIQPAYTARLFWLFQNAAVKDVASVDRKLPSGVKLSFAGNRLWLSSRASIPPTSALITFAGCALLLILGLLVTCARQSKLSSDLSAQNVAEILLNTSEYPGMLIKSTVLLNKGDINSGGQHVESLDKFVISEVALSHQTDASVQKIVVAPPLGGSNVV